MTTLSSDRIFLSGLPSQRRATAIDEALLSAVRADIPEMVRLCLNRGAHPDSRDRFGYTALMTAAILGRTEIVKVLVQNGIDVNARKEISGISIAPRQDGTTALHFAVEKGFLAIAEYLLVNGADVNVRTCDFGYTPLVMAVRRGDTQMVSLLLHYGADAMMRDRRGWSPLEHAKKAGVSTLTARTLRNAGAATMG